MVASIRQLLNLFLLNGYAFGGTVDIISNYTRSAQNASGLKLLVTLNAPATLWSSRILQTEKAKVSNDFFEKAVTQLVARAGYSSSVAAKFDGTTEELTVSIL